MKARSVTIHSLSILPGTGRGTSEAGGGAGAGVRSADPSRNPPVPLHHPADGPPPRSGGEPDTITLTAHVTKGTYIRRPARDLARARGTGGQGTKLRRTRRGTFAQNGRGQASTPGTNAPLLCWLCL